ncbi:MAG: hypothetical protein ABJL67_12670 [Sulfitobacter sp.]
MKKTILVAAKDGSPINFLTDQLREEAQGHLDRLAEFEVIIGKTASFGAGEPEIKKLRLVAEIVDPQDEQAEIIDAVLDEVIERLNGIATDLRLELIFEESEG